MNENAVLESLLFVAGEEGLSLEEIALLVDLPIERCHYLLMRLAHQLLQDENRGLQLILIKGRYQLVTKANTAEVIKQYAVSPFSTKFSQAALETLAIIAYSQPITRIEVDEIRGVQSSTMLQKLMHHGLIQESGRKEAPGRPILYTVTGYFYQYFGLNSLEDLPDISVLMTQLEEENKTALFDQEAENRNKQEESEESK